MAHYIRNNVWWVSFSHNGQRIQRSTGTTVKLAAQEYYDKFKAKLWNITKLDNKVVYSWRDALLRWLRENQHKRSINIDKVHLRWLDKHMRHYQLNEITRDIIENVANKKEEEGVCPTTVNRVLEVVRALLRKAQNEWEWIDKILVIRMRHVEKQRIRWLKQDEACTLLKELPSHLKDMGDFTLATGLRASNVTGFQWQDIDMKKSHAWIHPDQAKTKKAISLPLNDNAMRVLISRQGINSEFVFTYKNNPIVQCNTKAWRKALERAGIADFRWHDLRHTWASWHAQNGTSLQGLQMLGGWSSFEMVLRYAHISSYHLRSAANRIGSTKLTQNIGES